MATATHPRIDLDRYLRLFRKFPLVPIETDAQLKKATTLVHKLIDKDRTPEEDAYLEVLGTLVERYEERAHPMGAASDAAVLADRLDGLGISQAQMARDTGIAESTISAVLHGARKFTRAQLGKVAEFLKVPTDRFRFEE